MVLSRIFNHLITGLYEFTTSSNEQTYPYPLGFLRVCNALVKTSPQLFPPTLQGILAKFMEPLEKWWPSNWPLPQEFNIKCGLLDGERLSEEANAYYYDVLVEKAGLAEYKFVREVQHVLDNYPFKQLIDRLRLLSLTASESEIKQLQEEYIILRKFLIENPYTTTAKIQEVFAMMRYISTEEVGNLYEYCSAQQSYLQCMRCGPLTIVEGRIQGIRPSICNDHRVDQPNVVTIPWEPELRRILPGIHWRVCFPGISEIRLYNILQDLFYRYPEQIKSIDLWPGLDQYDLRICFQDQFVWAVDVKDHRDPYRLAKELRAIPNNSPLQYNAGFYVIPDHWLHQQPNYLNIIREKAKSLSTNEVTSLSDFVVRVEEKIRQAKPKRKRK